MTGGPRPPTDLVMPETAELVFTILSALPGIVLLTLAVVHLRDGRGPLLLICLLGGLLTSLYEPLIDVLGLVYLTENGSIATFEALGRTMPLFVPLGYLWYMGGFAYLTCRLLDRGIDRSGIFKLWGCFIVGNYILEAPGLLTDVYTYYGNQPLDVWGHPLWFGAMNGLTALLCGTLVHYVKPLLGRGWKLLALAPVIMMAEGFSIAGTGWPMFATLNSSLGYGWTYAACAVTLSLIALEVWIIGTAAERRLRSIERVEGGVDGDVGQRGAVGGERAAEGVVQRV